jgi:hypothetical protein
MAGRATRIFVKVYNEIARAGVTVYRGARRIYRKI